MLNLPPGGGDTSVQQQVLAGQISNFAYLWVNVHVGRAENPDVTRLSALTLDLGRAKRSDEAAKMLINAVYYEAEQERQQWP